MTLPEEIQKLHHNVLKGAAPHHAVDGMRVIKELVKTKTLGPDDCKKLLDIIEKLLQNWTGCGAQLRQCIEELRKKERLVNK